MTPTPFRVRSAREGLSHTFTLELEPPNGDFRFKPGQFTMVYAFGIGKVPISIGSSPTREATILLAIRRTGAVTPTATYGPGADWVRNVLAADSFRVDVRGVVSELTNGRLVGREEAWPYLPRLVRGAMRLLRVQVFVRADNV